MSTLFNAANETCRTENGAFQYHTTLSKCLDLFAKVGSCRDEPDVIVPLFRHAMAEDPNIALRIMLWSHDVRGGAGERQAFKNMVLEVLKDSNYQIALKRAILDKIPELGRWDTLYKVAKDSGDNGLFIYVLEKLVRALHENNALCAKWLPRKGEVFNRLRGYLGITPKQLRKLLKEVAGFTVERLMSANQWDKIVYEHVPSVAMARYRNAFMRHDPDRFQAYLDAVRKNETKINAGVVFPHDVIRNCRTAPKAVQAQWENLPNYADTQDNILCMADVSGSMTVPVSGSVTAMDIALGLAIYISERNHGPFKDEVILFSGKPSMQKLSGNIYQKMYQLQHVMNPYNTDFIAALELILNSAKRFKIPPAEMPTKLLVLSDMQFDHSLNMTVYREILMRYHEAGYEVPEIVFWNLNARYTDGQMVTRDAQGCALISGYSPVILKEVLKGKIPTPYEIMMSTIGGERYKL